MTTLEQLPQPLAQLDLHSGQIRRQLELRVEIAVVYGADLDPQPSLEHTIFGDAEAGHTARHRALNVVSYAS